MRILSAIRLLRSEQVHGSFNKLKTDHRSVNVGERFTAYNILVNGNYNKIIGFDSGEFSSTHYTVNVRFNSVVFQRLVIKRLSNPPPT